MRKRSWSLEEGEHCRQRVTKAPTVGRGMGGRSWSRQRTEGGGRPSEALLVGERWTTPHEEAQES